MTTLFISDLHLEPGRPEITRLFLELLGSEASGAEALYILGDLFEFWIGDDVNSPLADEVSQCLRQLADKGVPVYFIHGNRDFLLGEEYADAAGMQLLPQVHKLDLHGVDTLIMHGDSLCLDDIEYQKFRRMVREPAWQQQLLSRSVEERLQIAAEYRDASKSHTDSSPMEIMDVTRSAVEAIMQKYQVNRLIHGHTHRPAIHQLTLGTTAAERIVLGDWYRHGSVLRVNNESIELAELHI